MTTVVFMFSVTAVSRVFVRGCKSRGFLEICFGGDVIRVFGRRVRK